MILYLDSSSAVKLYIQEQGSEDVRHHRDDAEALTTSRVTYAEVRAALARAQRGRRIAAEEEYRRTLQDFERDWRSLVVLAISERLVRRAGDLAEKHALRGYDAVQLASALALKRDVPTDFRFSSHDDELKQAAQEEGLTIA